MGWGLIGPYFLEDGNVVTVNKIRYREIISNFLLLEIEDMKVNDMWFQQEDATFHISAETCRY